MRESSKKIQSQLLEKASRGASNKAGLWWVSGAENMVSTEMPRSLFLR